MEEGTYSNEFGQWWFRQFSQQITPSLSAYIICKTDHRQSCSETLRKVLNIGSISHPWVIQDHPRLHVTPADDHSLVADSIADFSDAQGSHNWFYGYYVSPIRRIHISVMSESRDTSLSTESSFADEISTVTTLSR